MTGLEIWLLAIGLAMDCFAVSIASGIILKRTRWKPMLIMAFTFGLFQAIMPFIGWMFAKSFSHFIESIDHWIAFALLAFLGIRMIRAQFKEEETASFNPTSLKVTLALAVATSIDALAIGISFAFAGFKQLESLWMPLTSIGIASFVLSLAGSLIGVFFGKRFHLRVEIFGGLVLIGIGIKILVEHLFLQ